MRWPRSKPKPPPSVTELETLVDDLRSTSHNLKGWTVYGTVSVDVPALLRKAETAIGTLVEDGCAPLAHEILLLRTEVDCRIEHGADSGGHLEYVRDRLDRITAA